MGIFDRFKKEEPEADPRPSPEKPSGPANPQGPDGPDAPQPPGGPQRTDAPSPGQTDVQDSNPNAGGPGGLEGDMGISSERTGADGSTDGAAATSSDAAIDGPEMDETQNPAEVPSHKSDPKSNPGTSSQGST